MAEKIDKKPPQTDEQTRFETEVYKFGLELIEDCRKGTCRDYNKTVEAIIAIFRRND